jgi:thiol-disulfide isomerase/thioredoxin
MKKILIIFALFCTITSLSAQGIEFFHGTWEEAQAKAQTEQKLLFVDAYASWCGPCKHMAKNVFTLPKAGDFFNANFICLKIDMEKEENAVFAGKYPVSAYPTLMFLDDKGKVVMKEVGAKDVDGLIESGRKALGKNNRFAESEKIYTEGNREPQAVFNYVRALNQAGKPSLKITNEYLKTQTDLTSEFNLRFILEGAVEADSRVFDLLLQHRDKIAALAGESAVNTKLEQACKNSLKKAIEFKNTALLEEVKAKIKKARPEIAEKFSANAEMEYYKATDDPKKFLKAATAYQKNTVKKNPALLDDLVANLLRAYPNDAKVLATAEKWAKMAAENGEKAEYYMSWANVCKRRGDKLKAKSLAEKALKLADKDDVGMRSKIDVFIQTLGV